MAEALILDTETTGVDEPHVVELAWLQVAFRADTPCEMLRGEKFVALYRPGKPISYGAMAVHHIMDEDVAACPPSTEARVPQGIEYIIGHNVDFDWSALGQPPVRRIDTLCLARRAWPELDSHSLGALTYYLYRRDAPSLLRDAHSAWGDVVLTANLLDDLLVTIDPLPETFADLWAASEAARIPTTMPFGKHRGTPIADVPSDYKRWLLGQDNVDPYLRKALLGTGDG